MPCRLESQQESQGFGTVAHKRTDLPRMLTFRRNVGTRGWPTSNRIEQENN